MVDEPGVRFGISNGLIVIAMFAAASTHLDVSSTEALVVIVTGLVSAGLSLLVTASLGVVAWAMVTGFAENRYGELTFAGGDLRRLLLATVATVGIAVLIHHSYLRTRERIHG